MTNSKIRGLGIRACFGFRTSGFEFPGLGVLAALATLSLTAPAFAADTTTLASPAAAPPTRRLELFNGRDLSGWTLFLSDPAADPRASWSVADGVLRLAGKPNGYLRTVQSYSNYRLHIEWRWPAGGAARPNSGVFVHVQGKDLIWPQSVECQLASGNAGQLVGNDVQLPGAPIQNKKPRAPKLAAASEKPLGEWNTYEIVCQGDTIDVTVNGVHQNHVEKCSASSGGIGLQLEGHPIEFRHLWLDPL